jgi:hypothetical protein
LVISSSSSSSNSSSNSNISISCSISISISISISSTSSISINISISISISAQYGDTPGPRSHTHYTHESIPIADVYNTSSAETASSSVIHMYVHAFRSDRILVQRDSTLLCCGKRSSRREHTAREAPESLFPSYLLNEPWIARPRHLSAPRLRLPRLEICLAESLGLPRGPPSCDRGPNTCSSCELCNCTACVGLSSRGRIGLQTTRCFLFRSNRVESIDRCELPVDHTEDSSGLQRWIGW